jgi:Clostripain family
VKVFAFALLTFGLISQARAGALPSCKDQWRGQRYDYDFHEDYQSFQSRLHRDGCEKDWTVLVYMAADNSLFPYALMDLYEMEAAFKSRNVAGSTLKTDLLVQVDGPATDDLRRLHIFSGPVQYEEKSKDDFADKTLDVIQSPVVARLPENDGKTERERLSEFLTWAARRYPSRHYMVIVWGHGQGWKSFPVEDPASSRLLHASDAPAFPKPAPDKSFGGIAFRQSSGTWLDVPALSSALGDLRDAIGKPVDVYASDACLMQMLEVAYEVGANARFVVGSAQVQSFFGLPYRRILYELNKGSFDGLHKENRDSEDGSDEPYLLAKMIPILMKASLNPRGHGLQSSDKEAIKTMTSSALTIGEFDSQLVPAMATLGNALRAYLLEDSSRAMELRYITQNVPNIEGSAQDFGVFLGFVDQLLAEERAKKSESPAGAVLRDAVAGAKDALDRTVLSYTYGESYGVDAHSQLTGFVPRAVSIWLPVSGAELQKRRDEFQASRFYRATHWQDWLDTLFAKK